MGTYSCLCFATQTQKKLQSGKVKKKKKKSELVVIARVLDSSLAING